jgi:hypothetical protein
VITTIVGSVGFVVLLSAFSLNLAGRLDRSGPTYSALNVLGAGVLAWYATQKDAPVLAALEAIWSAIAVITLALALRRRRGHVLAPEPHIHGVLVSSAPEQESVKNERDLG